MTRYYRARFAALLVALFLSLGVSGQVVQRLIQVPPSGGERIALSDSVPERVATAERLGSLPGNTELTGLSLVLKPSETQDAALTQLLADQQDPSKPTYHRWLTPQQFGERFGMADADILVLRTWLEQAGLRIDGIAASRNSILFSGTAADIAAAFGTVLERYRDDAQSFHANSVPVQLPNGLAAVIQGISGLSSYRPTPRTGQGGAHRLAARPTSSNSYDARSPQYTEAGTNGIVHYLVPWDFRQIYGINGLIGSGFDGTGIKIGVIGQSAVNTQQLTYFQGKTGQPVKMPTMVLVPNSGVSNLVSGDEAESELDLEYSSGSAPGANVQFIYSGCTATASQTALGGTTDCGNDGVFTALAYAVTNNLAPILSLSYGDCESSLATLASTTLEPILKQANAQGQTVLVSSGDGGAAACDQSVVVATHGLTVQYPASSTYVTAVGGTELNSDSAADWNASNNGSLGSAAGYMPETAWNDTSTTGIIAAGTGGVSKIYQMPAWQQPYKLPGAYFRMVPDVSFAASLISHPYMVCLGAGPCTSGAGGFTPGQDGVGVGGTSVAAPNFAAMLAVVEQANGGGALGNVNPALYALAAGTSAPTVLHDIVTGDNIVPCKASTTDCQLTGSMGFSAGTGYDLVTGLGSVSAPSLRAALQSLSARTVTLALHAFPQRIDIPAPQLGTQFTVELDALSKTTVLPTGSVTFAIDGIPQGAAQPLYNGEALGFLSLNTLGRHTISAAYSGDMNFDNASTSIAVTPIAAAPVINVNVPNSRVSLQTPVAMQAIVSAGTVTPTGTVTFVVDGALASSQLSLVSGQANFSYPGFQTAGQHTVVASYSGDALVTAGSSQRSIVSITVPTQTQTATVTVSAAQAPSIGVPLTITVAVKSPSPGTTAPTGFVTFNADGATLPTTALDVTGKASITHTYTTSGPSNVSVAYSGDSLFYANSGNLSLYVPGPPAPTIALALSSLTANIPASGTATVGLSVSSGNGFSGPVSFTSSIVSGTGAAFSGCYVVSPGVVFPSSGTPAIAMLSMALASSRLCTKPAAVRMKSIAFSGKRKGQGSAPWAALSLAGMLGCAAFSRRVPRRLLSLLVLASALGISGCGGSGGSSTTTTTTTTTTPAPTPSPTYGTYLVSVTATALTTGVSSSGTFTLTVQ